MEAPAVVELLCRRRRRRPDDAELLPDPQRLGDDATPRQSARGLHLAKRPQQFDGVAADLDLTGDVTAPEAEFVGRPEDALQRTRRGEPDVARRTARRSDR